MSFLKEFFLPDRPEAYYAARVLTDVYDCTGKTYKIYAAHDWLWANKQYLDAWKTEDTEVVHACRHCLSSSVLLFQPPDFSRGYFHCFQCGGYSLYTVAYIIKDYLAAMQLVYGNRHEPF